LARPQYNFRQRGQTGKWVSDLIPDLAELTDDIAFVHSLTSTSNTHGPAENFLSTGFVLDGFPSLGSWVTYALGSENQNLPSYVAIPDPRGVPQNGSNNWGPGFLPTAFQGTTLSFKEPVRHLIPPGIASSADLASRSLLQKMNARHLEQHPGDGKLAARIASYELAARMQLEATEAFDISKEPDSIRRMYGEGVEARQILIARRLVERGVRFVQAWVGSDWDHHQNLERNLSSLAKQCDQAIGALLKDLKQRGMLDDTLVICGGEFGRTPTVEVPMGLPNNLYGNGRDHNHHGFTTLLAGGGVKGGYVHGATDEFGFQAVEQKVHVHDLHATILHLLGFDHTRLTYRHASRDFRLTDVYGEVIHDLIA
jgi:hypothetical protein